MLHPLLVIRDHLSSSCVGSLSHSYITIRHQQVMFGRLVSGKDLPAAWTQTLPSQSHFKSINGRLDQNCSLKSLFCLKWQNYNEINTFIGFYEKKHCCYNGLTLFLYLQTFLNHPGFNSLTILNELKAIANLVLKPSPFLGHPNSDFKQRTFNLSRCTLVGCFMSFTANAAFAPMPLAQSTLLSSTLLCSALL